MDALILCGGKGTRLSEETVSKPKPMVNIGGKPILWHIMKIYSYYNVNRFIIALGYKGDLIKEYFYNYRITSSDFSLKFDNNKINYINNSNENNWEIVFVDTGQETLKGARIKKVEKHILSDSFHLTYGDGVCDVNLENLMDFHKSHGSLGTVTAVRPPSRFGELELDGDTVMDLEEKPQMGKGYINGGFFIFKKEIFNYLTNDENCDFEFGPLQKVVSEKKLKAYKHDGFWQCMDNIREKIFLDEQIKKRQAQWIKWG